MCPNDVYVRLESFSTFQLYSYYMPGLLSCAYCTKILIYVMDPVWAKIIESTARIRGLNVAKLEKCPIFMARVPKYH